MPDFVHELLRAEKYFSARFPLRILEVAQGPLAEHSHEFWELVYVRRGRGEHCLEGRRFALSAGDVAIIRPGQSHAYAASKSETMRIVNVLWMPSLVEGLLPDFAGAGGAKSGATALQVLEAAPLLHLSGPAALRVEALLDEMRREQGEPAAGHEILLRHLFCALMLLLARAAHEESQHSAPERGASSKAAERVLVARAVAWIEAHHTRPIKVEEVASHVALSPSRLSHIFKAHTGRGVIEYLHEHRVARAASLLCCTQKSGAEIAREVGFGDARFFRRIFARHTGCAPTHFRRHFGT